MKKSIFIVFSMIFGVIFTPFIASAVVFANAPATNVGSLASWMSQAFNVATSLLIGAAIVFFLYNVFGFVTAGGDEEGKSEKRKGIIQGLIGIAIMMGVYGLVNFFLSSAGLTAGGAALPAPTVQTV